MSEIRKDYLTSRIVIVPKSSKKSFEVIEPKKEKKGPKIITECEYCAGNEEKTPSAIIALVQREGSLIKQSDEEGAPIKDWVVRVFECKEPVVTTSPTQAYGDRPLYSEPAYGYHYVVVATPNHSENLTEMPIEQLSNILTIIQDKVRWMYSQKKVSYVSVIVNRLANANITMSHPHLEIFSLPQVPPTIDQEATAILKSMSDVGICPVCSIVSVESGGPRQILSTDNYICIAPWASANSYEFWILPKKHQTSFIKTSQKEITDLALILRCSLGGMAKSLNNPYFSLVFHISAEKKITRQLHWHIEVYPNKKEWGGLEKGMGVFINEVSPEDVAALLGAYSRKELATLIGVK